ncbi:MAG: hypothetical protein ABJA10_02745 [Aestuariivirga sp.]
MNLKTYLLTHNVGGEEMARRITERSKLECTGAAVRNWADGIRMPTVELAQALCDATDGEVTIQDLHEFRLAKIRSELPPAQAEVA